MFSPLVPLAELARRTVGDPDGIDPATPDGVRALANLDDASWLVRQAAGRTSETHWPDAASVPPPVRVIVLRAARRAWENPEATTAESISGGGVSTTREAEPNAVYLTEGERAELAAFAPARGGAGLGGLGSIATTVGSGGPPRRSTIYAPWSDGGAPVPWLADDDPAAP